MIEQRKAAANRPRRILMNTDGGDTTKTPPDEPRTAENFLKYRVGALVGSQVDVILDNTAGEFFACDPTSEEGDFSLGGGPVHDWAQALIDQGLDGLQLKIDFGRANGMEVFRSFRMNDTHDAKLPHLATPWKTENPECLMGEKADEFPYCMNRWSALDFGQSKVRDKVFRVIEQICTRYDIDGIDLDFYRHPHYFRPQMTGDPVTQEHCDLMTDLMRRLRTMVDEVSRQRLRPLLVLVRVFDSIGYSKAIGLDIERWLDEELVDMVAGGGYDHLEPWENLVELGRRHDVPVFACISASRLKRSSFLDPESLKDTCGWMGRTHPLFAKIWRGEAASAWNAGVSGIYTFNLHDPGESIFHEMGSLETLEGLESLYEFNPGIHADTWLKDGSSYIRRPA